MCDDFGIGFGLKGVAFVLQLLFEGQVVFHNAVMHHHDVAGAVAMRVSILFGGAPVGGPPGVTDAIAAIDRV